MQTQAASIDRQANNAAVPPSGFRAPWVIFGAGLLARVLYMTLAHTWRVPYRQDHFEFGWEAARIARSVATGHGYSDPFILGNTGPTAWLPPLFPLMIAGCFRLFGVYTSRSGRGGSGLFTQRRCSIR